MKKSAIIVFCACVALSACGADDGKQIAKTELPPKGSAPVVVDAPEIPAQNNTADIPQQNDIVTDSTDEKGYTNSKDEILSLWIQGVKDILQNQWGDNWTLNQRDNMISATMWYDGVIDDALISAVEQGGVPAEWDEMCSSFERNAQSAYKSMVDVGLDDMHLMYSIANDRNPDNVLLVTYDGDIVYDIFDELRNNETPKLKDYYSDAQIVAAFMLAIQHSLNDSAKDIPELHYKVDRQDNIILIFAWYDGLIDSIFQEALSQGGKIPQSWWNLRETEEQACKNYYDTMVNTWGLNDMHISINLINDANTDNVLLQILDGVTVYDYMEE